MYSSDYRTKERGKEKGEKLAVETGDGSPTVMDDHSLQSAGIIIKVTQTHDGGCVARKDKARAGTVTPGQGESL